MKIDFNEKLSFDFTPHGDKVKKVELIEQIELGGKQMVIHLKDGKKMSVIRNNMSYTSRENDFEIAVLGIGGNLLSLSDLGTSDHVLGHQSIDDIYNHIEKL